MTKANTIITGGIAVLALAVGGGFLGASLSGSGGSAAAAADYSATPFLDAIKKRGELRVGIAEAPPMSGTQPDGTLGGPNVLPLQQLAEDLDVKFTPIAADWANVVAGLQAGRYDFAANLDSTTERALSIQFTQDVYSYDNVFTVTADSPYVTAEDVIAGGPIASVTGIAAAEALEDTGAEILSVDSHANQVSALKSGRAVAAYFDLASAVDSALQDPTLKVIIPDPVVYRSGAGYGVLTDIDPRSLQIVNVTIQNAIDSGALARAIEDAGIHLDAAGLDEVIKK
jgi:ABC-type amino acid transport substrate-binding protein